MTTDNKNQKNNPDKSAGVFKVKLIEAALSIPEGKVVTYSALACAAGGSAINARNVTAILMRAAEAGEGGAEHIPFHRIVYAEGRAWAAREYYKPRMALYKKEGIDVDPKTLKIRNFADVLYEF